MNHRPAKNLDAFEAALLIELQAVRHQAVHTAPDHRVSGQPVRRRHPKRWQITVATAAAAALAIALLVPVLGPTRPMP